METLKLGSAGKEVQKLQEWLNTLGYYILQDAKYGPEDEKAVKDFQSAYFLPVTGMVDNYLFKMFRTLARDTEEGDFTPKMVTPGVSSLAPQPLPINPGVRELQKIGTTNAKTVPAVAQTATNVAAKRYTTLAAGKADYDALLKSNLPAAQKTQLAGALKKKILFDVYGKAYKNEIDALRATIQSRETWLMPEGMDAWMQLTLDSENLFNDGFYRKGIYYNYTVERMANSETARLLVKAVKNNMSNVVFSTSLTAKIIGPQQIDVDIFMAKNVGYTWQESRADYLESLFSATSDAITPKPMGGMTALRDTNHGYNPAEITRKVITKDFSVKNAIKTAVRYFILDYNKALKAV